MYFIVSLINIYTVLIIYHQNYVVFKSEKFNYYYFTYLPYSHINNLMDPN